jgi:protein-S-isoprenylcysteine O-methyltransferase Ste14
MTVSSATDSAVAGVDVGVAPAGVGRRAGSGSTDLGKVAMVAIATVLSAFYCVRVASDVRVDGVGVSAATHGLIAAFYAVIVVAYLRRGGAKRTSDAVLPRVAAVVATWLPLSAPFLGQGAHRAGLVALGDALLLAGLSWSLWSVAALGRSLSIVPQAREVVSSGPYRLVRHPLYLGELTMLLGIAVVSAHPAVFGLWCVTAALQLYRMRHEERLLAATLTSYAAYRARTARLLPFVY